MTPKSKFSNPKPQRSSKLQAPTSKHFGLWNWSFGFLWGSEFGAWSFRRVVAVAFFAAAAAFADPDAATDAKPTYQFPKPQRIKGVENYGKVSDALYRGSQPTPDGFKELKRMGIKTIVDTSFFTWSRDKLDGYGYRYINLPFNPNKPHEYPLIQFLKVMEDKENHPVFVHCLTGGDRTGAYVAAYRVHVQKWTKEKALAEMDVYGFRTTWWTATIKLFNNLDLDAFKKKVEAARKPEVKVIN